MKPKTCLPCRVFTPVMRVQRNISTKVYQKTQYFLLSTAPQKITYEDQVSRICIRSEGTYFQIQMSSKSRRLKFLVVRLPEIFLMYFAVEFPEIKRVFFQCFDPPADFLPRRLVSWKFSKIRRPLTLNNRHCQIQPEGEKKRFREQNKRAWTSRGGRELHFCGAPIFAKKECNYSENRGIRGQSSGDPPSWRILLCSLFASLSSVKISAQSVRYSIWRVNNKMKQTAFPQKKWYFSRWHTDFYAFKKMSELTPSPLPMTL